MMRQMATMAVSEVSDHFSSPDDVGEASFLHFQMEGRQNICCHLIKGFISTPFAKIVWHSWLLLEGNDRVAHIRVA